MPSIHLGVTISRSPFHTTTLNGACDLFDAPSFRLLFHLSAGMGDVWENNPNSRNNRNSNGEMMYWQLINYPLLQAKLPLGALQNPRT